MLIKYVLMQKRERIYALLVSNVDLPGIFPQSESFGLYALYSKNKPRSDALILHRRHDLFKVIFLSSFP